MSLDPSPTRRVALLIFLACFGLYALFSAGRLRLPDEQEVYFQAQSLAERGELAVPQAVKLGVFFGKRGKRDGKPYAPYGPGTALFVLPHYLAARAAAGVVLGEAATPAALFSLRSLLTCFATAFYSALAVALLWLVCSEIGVPPRRALLVTLALALGTVVFSYATVFFSEGVQTAFLLASLLALLRGRMTLAGLALGAAVLCKAPTIVLAPGFAALAYFGRYGQAPSLRRVLALAWPVALACAFHLGWNTWRFESPLDFGYDWSETMPEGVKARGFSATYWRGLVGLTISPGKGLLFFAPPVLLGLAGLKGLYAQERSLALGVGLMAMASILFWPNFLGWDGGYCIGPRQVVPLIPFLVLPACFATLPSWSFKALTGIGLALQLLCVTTPFLQDQSFGPKRLPALQQAWAGKRALLAGDLEQAKDLAGRSALFDPTPEAYRVLAEVCVRQGRLDLALRLEARAALQTPPPFVPYYHLLEDPPQGQFRNRYNLLYTPWVTLPPRLIGGLREGPIAAPLGNGIENWYCFAKKLRRAGVTTDARSFEEPLALAFLLLLLGGVWGLRRHWKTFALEP